jgi:hypothetical protein
MTAFDTFKNQNDYQRMLKKKKTYQDIVTPSKWILENGLWAVSNPTPNK